MSFIRIMPDVAFMDKRENAFSGENLGWRLETIVYLELLRRKAVTETGKVADIKILRSVNDDLDREAVRVVAQSPLWTPGRDENGKVVPVKYTFPVIFKLPDSENK